MTLKRLPGTCSMLELYQVNMQLRHFTSSTVQRMIDTYRMSHGADRDYGTPRAIILNSNENMTWFERRRFRKITGFKRVATYMGNIKSVNTYILYLNK